MYPNQTRSLFCRMLIAACAALLKDYQLQDVGERMHAWQSMDGGAGSHARRGTGPGDRGWERHEQRSHWREEAQERAGKAAQGDAERRHRWGLSMSLTQRVHLRTVDHWHAMEPAAFEPKGTPPSLRGSLFGCCHHHHTCVRGFPDWVLSI